MLNIKEKYNVCEAIAGWEWTQGGSTAEAGAYGQCALKLRNLFKIENEDWDLAYARALEIQQLATRYDPIASDDEFFDRLCDLIVEDYLHVIDLCDSRDMAELLTAVKELI